MSKDNHRGGPDGHAGPYRPRWIGLAVILTVALLAALAIEFVRTAPTRGAVGAFATLIAAANAGDVALASRTCSRDYLATHRLVPAREGGIVGLPRGIHKNFRTWERRDVVWICPTNRVGPIYRLVFEDERWKFSGLVGQLRSGNVVELVPVEEGSP